jgi:hypothetical protein
MPKLNKDSNMANTRVPNSNNELEDNWTPLHRYERVHSTLEDILTRLNGEMTKSIDSTDMLDHMENIKVFDR